MESWGSGAVDCGVGSIVWVRRRNGSWWPGKIMGPNELSATHLVSPRTGTPVKLLGREDASVDWYNLEKSKRVKAFRCGEFDECIERAESSLGMPAKKREKYARREDAILHALELEKQLLEKEQGQLIASDVKSRKFSNFVKKKLAASSKSFSYANGNLGNAKPDQCSTGSDSSPKDEKVSPFYVPKDKEGNQLGLRDVKSGLVPRNRGLQDFGLKATHSKRKFCSGTSNGSQRPTADDQTYASSYNGASMGGTSHANSRNILDARKMPNERLTEDILVKRRDRRRPIVQVLQSSETLSPHLLQSDNHTLSLSESGVDLGNISRAKRSRCVYLPSEFSDCLGDTASVPNQMETYVAGGDCRLPGSLTEENPCEFIEDEQSESSETEDLDTDSDGETNTLSGSSDTDSDSPGGSEVQGKHESVGNDELDEFEVSGDLSNICPYDHPPANAGVSKWQIKGKRNVRYFTKKLGVGADVKGSSGFNDGTYMEEKGTTFNRSALEHGLSFNHRSDGFSSGLNEAEKINKGYRTQMTGLDNGGYTSTSKAASNRRNRTGHDIVDWEDLAWEDQLSFRGYLDAGEYLDPVFVGRQHLGGRMRTMLIDVDLKVQTSYKKEHVPIVSLMSKIDGKAIIGHPIQIEVLREGLSSEILFSSKNDFDNEIHYNEGDRTLPPVWRTARRTANCRVPRPQLSSALDSDEAAERLPHLGQERKPPFKKPNAWGFRQKESMMSKDLPLIPRPPIDRKLSRKLPKRASLPSSQKTRTLSSIGVEQKLRHPRHDTNSYLFDGLIKTDSVVTPVACIPVKLVFSRLYEAVGRRPSIASTANHEALINMDTETNPL